MSDCYVCPMCGAVVPVPLTHYCPTGTTTSTLTLDDDPIAKIRSAKIAGVEQFVRWLLDCRRGWPEDKPSPHLEYVAAVMAQQYANWLDGRNPDSERPGWPREARLMPSSAAILAGMHVPPITPDVEQAAVRVICGLAHDADDAKLLLDMLGLEAK